MVFWVFEGLFTRVHSIKIPFLTLENGFFRRRKGKKGFLGRGTFRSHFLQKGSWVGVAFHRIFFANEGLNDHYDLE